VSFNLRPGEQTKRRSSAVSGGRGFADHPRGPAVPSFGNDDMLLGMPHLFRLRPGPVKQPNIPDSWWLLEAVVIVVLVLLALLLGTVLALRCK
jgi:hypothetical protein